MKHTEVGLKLVDLMPPQFAPGILYVSRKYRTASHLCCCGCGTRIVTPLRETGWKLSVDDGKASLWPSIGNSNHPCQSHYVISEGKVVWHEPMTPAHTAWTRARDDANRAAYFARKSQQGRTSIFASTNRVGQLLGKALAWTRALLSRWGS